MHHRLQILKEQQERAKTTTLRMQYQTNMTQIEQMLEKEPPMESLTTLERELALQILALDDQEGEEDR